MEKIKNRIISGMMALVLVVSLMAVAPVNTYAETKYVKSYTQTYTLKKSTKYKIPLKMKQDADLTVQITILDGTAGEQMYVVPWLWEDYEELLGVSCNGDEELGLGYYAKGKNTICKYIDIAYSYVNRIRGFSPSYALSNLIIRDVSLEDDIRCEEQELHL